MEALKLVAEKKYPGDAKGLAELERKIISEKEAKIKGPEVNLNEETLDN